MSEIEIEIPIQSKDETAVSVGCRNWLLQMPIGRRPAGILRIALLLLASTIAGCGPTEDQKQTYIQQGYRQGYAQGQGDGQQAGYQQGLNEGVKRGREEGYKDGNAEGYRSGLAEGQRLGHKKGKEEGKAEGYREGFEEGKMQGFKNGKAEGIKEGQGLREAWEKRYAYLKETILPTIGIIISLAVLLVTAVIIVHTGHKVLPILRPNETKFACDKCEYAHPVTALWCHSSSSLLLPIRSPFRWTLLASILILTPIAGFFLLKFPSFGTTTFLVLCVPTAIILLQLRVLKDALFTFILLFTIIGIIGGVTVTGFLQGSEELLTEAVIAVTILITLNAMLLLFDTDIRRHSQFQLTWILVGLILSAHLTIVDIFAYFAQPFNVKLPEWLSPPLLRLIQQIRLAILSLVALGFLGVLTFSFLRKIPPMKSQQPSAKHSSGLSGFFKELANLISWVVQCLQTLGSIARETLTALGKYSLRIIGRFILDTLIPSLILIAYFAGIGILSWGIYEYLPTASRGSAKYIAIGTAILLLITPTLIAYLAGRSQKRRGTGEPIIKEVLGQGYRDLLLISVGTVATLCWASAVLWAVAKILFGYITYDVGLMSLTTLGFGFLLVAIMVAYMRGQQSKSRREA